MSIDYLKKKCRSAFERLDPDTIMDAPHYDDAIEHFSDADKAAIVARFEGKNEELEPDVWYEYHMRMLALRIMNIRAHSVLSAH